MVFGVLLCALIVGGVGSGQYLKQKWGKHGYFRTNKYVTTNTRGAKSFPSLYEADIDTLASGLACKEFTSVDLVKASDPRIFEQATKLALMSLIDLCCPNQ